MCKRESKFYDDASNWHIKFFEEVTSRINEEIFKPLFTEGNKGGKDGRPNASIRTIIAMCVIKEGCGYSDEALFEICRFHLLYRRAIGLINVDEPCPSLGAYYLLRKRICEYEEKRGVNLFNECFKDITHKQIKTYEISGKSVRMDSKLISSIIAWYSRYEIIHETLLKSTRDFDAKRIEDQLTREQFLEFLKEDAAKTVYRSEPETMTQRLLSLGFVIDYILTHSKQGEFPLLSRVFQEQYDKDKDGVVHVREKKLISAKSVQNPHDPDAQYRSKNGKKIKGYSTNITETTDEKDKPSLITDIQIKGASAADNGFVADAIKATEEVTGNAVKVLYADVTYQSEDNRELAAAGQLEFVANGMQGKQSRFDLNQVDESTLEVIDKQTSEVVTAIPAKPDKEGKKQWKIRLNGKTTWRYFKEKHIERAVVRHKVESIPAEKRKRGTTLKQQSSNIATTPRITKPDIVR